MKFRTVIIGSRTLGFWVLLGFVIGLVGRRACSGNWTDAGL